MIKGIVEAVAYHCFGNIDPESVVQVICPYSKEHILNNSPQSMNWDLKRDPLTIKHGHYGPLYYDKFQEVYEKYKKETDHDVDCQIAAGIIEDGMGVYM